MMHFLSTGKQTQSFSQSALFMDAQRRKYVIVIVKVYALYHREENNYAFFKLEFCVVHCTVRAFQFQTFNHPFFLY